MIELVDADFLVFYTFNENNKNKIKLFFKLKIINN
ncbi:MAG: hypothetical protein RL571_451 [Pseudomonadota bacterium]|jgi:hypothetical protein